MLSKNQELTGKITAVTGEGAGVCKDGGETVFIPFAIDGETVEYKILKAGKDYSFGKLQKILTPSEDRVEPLCKYYYKCGGCQLQHINYQRQLKIKKEKVETAFKKIANLSVSVEDTEKSPKEYGYRNKLQLPVAEVNGKTEMGFYAENSHRVIEIDDCPITPWSGKVIKAFKDYFELCNIKGYNEEKNSGDIRHVVVREIDGNFIFCVVTSGRKLKGKEKLIEILKKDFENFSLFQNINEKKNNVILGDEFINIFGKERYTSSFENITYSYGVSNFLQVNKAVSEEVYKKVVSLCGGEKNEIVIDAFSGAGIMTAMLTGNAQKVYGIEIIKEAVSCAEELAKSNNLTDKMESICGKCEEVLPPLCEKLVSEGKKITVVLDPPRKGVEKEVIEAVKKANVEKIVYVSCNPSTLARDVGLLTGSLICSGNEIKRAENFSPEYSVSLVKPYDMFPQTKHVETIVCLTKKTNETI